MVRSVRARFEFFGRGTIGRGKFFEAFESRGLELGLSLGDLEVGLQSGDVQAGEDLRFFYSRTFFNDHSAMTPGSPEEIVIVLKSSE